MSLSLSLFLFVIIIIVVVVVLVVAVAVAVAVAVDVAVAVAVAVAAFQAATTGRRNERTLRGVITHHLGTGSHGQEQLAGFPSPSRRPPFQRSSRGSGRQ